MVGLLVEPGRRYSQAARDLRATHLLVPLVLLAAVLGTFTGSIQVASATPLPSTVEAWIHPASLGQPTCDVPGELSALAAHPIAVLKPEYLTVNGRGRVVTETATSLPCNGYSAANLASVRAAARRVLVTVSAGSGTKPLLANRSRAASAVSSIEG